MAQLVNPTVALANLDAGTLFQSDGKVYILLAHLPLNVLIARYYWFDRVFDQIVERLREKIRRIRLKKEDKVDPEVESNDPKP